VQKGPEFHFNPSVENNVDPFLERTSPNHATEEDCLNVLNKYNLLTYDLEVHAIRILREFRVIESRIDLFNRRLENHPLDETMLKLINAKTMQSEVSSALNMIKNLSQEEYNLLLYRYVMNMSVKELSEKIKRMGKSLTRRQYEILRTRSMQNFIQICNLKILVPQTYWERINKRGRKTNKVLNNMMD